MSDIPDGCSYFAEDERGNRFIVWGPPPALGDDLCRALTGRSESDLVRRILNGEFNHIFDRKEATA